jgi:hypothetical protein
MTLSNMAASLMMQVGEWKAGQFTRVNAFCQLKYWRTNLGLYASIEIIF